MENYLPTWMSFYMAHLVKVCLSMRSMAAHTSIPDEFALIDYAAIIKRRWLWVLSTVLVLTSLTAAYTFTREPTYEATARVLLADSAAQAALDPSSQNPGFLTRELSNEISLAKSDRVERLVLEERAQLPTVSITAESAADVLIFRANAASDVGAADDANLWANAYVEVKRQEAVANITAATSSLQSRLEELRVERQELRAPLDELDRQLGFVTDPAEEATLQREYDRLADDLSYELQLVIGQAEATVASLNELEVQAELSAVGEARIIQVAAPPDGSSNSSPVLHLGLAGIAGLMLGVVLAMLMESRDRTIKSASDIHAITDLPVLAVIPKAARKTEGAIEVATLAEPDGALADGYHKLRSALEFISFDRNASSIMVTSAMASEGKTTTSSNLALALASVGMRTLLVDVDFRRGRIHKILGIDRTPGISDLVLRGAAPEQVSQRVFGADIKLWAVPTGSMPPNPASFVGTSRFLNTIDWLSGEADVVVLDAPPLLAVSEAHTLGKHVDVVVLTAMAGETTSDALSELIAELRQVGANIAGVVLIGVADADSHARYRDYSPINETAEHRAVTPDGPILDLADQARTAAAAAAAERSAPGPMTVPVPGPGRTSAMHPGGPNPSPARAPAPAPAPEARTNGARPTHPLQVPILPAESAPGAPNGRSASGPARGGSAHPSPTPRPPILGGPVAPLDWDSFPDNDH